MCSEAVWQCVSPHHFVMLTVPPDVSCIPRMFSLTPLLMHSCTYPRTWVSIEQTYSLHMPKRLCVIHTSYTSGFAQSCVRGLAAQALRSSHGDFSSVQIGKAKAAHTFVHTILNSSLKMRCVVSKKKPRLHCMRNLSTPHRQPPLCRC